MYYNLGPLFSVAHVEKVTLRNSYGEKLVGLLHETGSAELVILCHGLGSSKESSTIVSLVSALVKEGISVFHFDFAGNGESEGSFQFGNYSREVEDLHAVVLYFSGAKHVISAILGHSKGGNVVLLYASRYHDLPKVVNVSGRFDLKNGIGEHLGNDFLERIKKKGYIDVLGEKGEVQYRVTEDSLMERLSTDIHAASLMIGKNCRVLTVHGSMDEVIPVEDASEFAKIISNHKLHIVEGANHCYTEHEVELAEAVLDFIKG
ncbi:hypothetical protein GIB67_004156 [Kingdonia uniflora]|uniref:Serine aminopeptidase S33 domain-containing protein n=1 Tax=Kingdonia uniflora TaxID=39325 RepID=A0A7J7NS17_9MAGN|nr:hypothetical protein GIB67_004156 [Kingdonia uniflora]